MSAPAPSSQPTPYEWTFHYAGPRGPTEDPRCVSCNSKRAGSCMAHEKNFVVGCLHCTAAQKGACHSHWGLDAAIEHYEAHVLPSQTLGEAGRGAAEDWGRAKAQILADVANLPEHVKNVVVSARGNGGGHGTSYDLPREHVVHVTPR